MDGDTFSVKCISRESVLAAVRAGLDDIYQLADHFGVPHTSGTLRWTISQLGEAGQVTVDPAHGYRITAS